MPPTHTDEGILAAQHLRTTAPNTGVVVLSQYVEPALAVCLFANGSARRAYLLRDRVGAVDQIVDAILTVASGVSVVDAHVVDALVDARKATPGSPLDRLTARELTLLAGIAHGRTNAAIADELVLTVRAVEKHINSIFAKPELGADPGGHHRVRAALTFLQAQP